MNIQTCKLKKHFHFLANAANFPFVFHLKVCPHVPHFRYRAKSLANKQNLKLHSNRATIYLKQLNSDAGLLVTYMVTKLILKNESTEMARSHM